MQAPTVKKVPLEFELHGDIRQDEYYWLNEKTNPEVLAYLEAENQYFAHIMSPLQDAHNKLYNEMIARIPEQEVQVPVKSGPYFYYSRQVKELQYPIYGRKKANTRAELDSVPEEILLDLNVLAEGSDYLQVPIQRISPNHRYLAYAENRDGTDSHTLYIKDLQTGELLPDVLQNVYIYGSVEWSANGDYLFYVTLDEQQRPDKLWRHKMGTTEDMLLVTEEDVTFNLYLYKSQDGRYIFASHSATNTTEISVIDAHHPERAPWTFDERYPGIEYHVEHQNGQFLILTNENALNFTLKSCPENNLGERTPVIPYDESIFLENIIPFKNGLYLTGRAKGLQQIWELKEQKLVPLTWEDDIYSISMISRQDYDAQEILVEYESLLTPDTTISIDVTTKAQTVLQEKLVTGPYKRDDYVQEQVWATADDGTKIPILLHYHKDALAVGPAPLILSAYGSYGYSNDPHFSPYRLPILDSGVILATAQVRGGSEFGRSWYYSGRMQKKLNTFTDFIACADFLVGSGYTTCEKIAGRGGSAGGLLIGAVANMAGERFKVLVPEVPFVDVVTTMLDESIPLTTGEWDEWGNPKKAEDYHYIRSYSPYDNVESKPYPHMYVTTGLNDPRVGYWEPAKWVARLRELKTDANTLVLKTNMGAGHFGESGRFNELREMAECYTFILSKIT